MRRYRLAIVASHVIQYQDPFFRLLAAEADVDLTVFYCSMQGAEQYRDEDMKTTLRWDVDLLQGYRWKVLRNFARNPNAGFTRVVNPGIVPALLRGRFDAVIFMLGWGTITSLLGMLACRAARIPFFLFGDSSFPPPVTNARGAIRAGFLRTLFGLTTGFMTSGALNGDYYAHYGADRRRFFLLPWAVDNERFARAAAMNAEERAALRARYGIAREAFTIVFSAKLVPRKDPMTLLRAAAAMQHRATVLFLGDGELRGSLEAVARERRLDVAFAGFVNQTELPKHYAIADVFVLPSTYEPRGAVVNEAMACGLPVIVSDRCGSIGDIVRPGDNAFVFPAGDAPALAAQLDLLAGDPSLLRTMSERSRALIGEWDFARGVRGVRQMLEWVASGERT
jgi:glycosyltransferase involved in cell wall biosynthesis